MALVPSGQPSKKQKVIRPVELLCLEDNTSQINSTVPIDVPLFKPTPATVHFSGYEPFSTVTKTCGSETVIMWLAHQGLPPNLLF